MGWRDGTPITSEQPEKAAGTPAWMQGTPVSNVDRIPGILPQAQPKPEPGLIDKTIGGAEALLSAGTAIPAGLAGNVAGAVRAVTGGKYGTQEGVRQGEGVASSVAQAMTYQPRTDSGKETLSTIGNIIDASKIAGLGPQALPAATGISVTAGPALERITAPVRRAANTVGDMMRPAEPQMVGAGAAMTTAEALRRERAANLPVPIKLSKGEATRDFEQQRFEKETMKSAGGEPLRQHAADNVDKVIKNFEYWIDQSGAEAPDLIGTGKAVDRALVRKMESAKSEINNAYDKARKAGDMQAPVSVNELIGYLAKNEAAAENAGVISMAERTLKKLSQPDLNTGEMKVSVNDLEEIRKAIGVAGQKDATNAHYASELKKIIDPILDEGGGELYKKARGMYKTYAQEFKGQGAVRDLVSTKKGTTDRKVALEDVFNHSVLRGSNADTAAIMKSLETAGPEGMQAASELRGATMNYLLGKTTENAARDIRGQPIPSFSKIDKAVRSMDADGKLDLIFGKQQAAQIRDLKELIGDIQTAPPGAVNTSTTGAVLMEALGALATGRVPTATMKTIAGIKQAVGDRTVSKRVRDALIDPTEPSNSSGANTVH